MTLFAFRAPRPLMAASALRDMGFDSFAIMRMDRRAVARNVRKSTACERKPVCAVPGYVFAHGPVDFYQIAANRHVGRPISFDGQIRPLPYSAEQWLTDGLPRGLFHDTEMARYMNAPPVPTVSPGDVVNIHAGGLAGYQVTVDAVDGTDLLLTLRMLGGGKVRVPVRDVERAA